MAFYSKFTVEFLAEQRKKVCEVQFLRTLRQHLLDNFGIRFTPYTSQTLYRCIVSQG